MTDFRGQKTSYANAGHSYGHVGSLKILNPTFVIIDITSVLRNQNMNSIAFYYE